MAYHTWIGNYYLSDSGAMLKNAYTPDGYRVGADGAWVRPNNSIQPSDLPLSRDLRIVLQASHGYGDSLIDYNYKQTVVGVGFTFLSL